MTPTKPGEVIATIRSLLPSLLPAQPSRSAQAGVLLDPHVHGDRRSR
jgi:hypothetical protein